MQCSHISLADEVCDPMSRISPEVITERIQHSMMKLERSSKFRVAGSEMSLEFMLWNARIRDDLGKRSR
jgi:hypothetical protein